MRIGDVARLLALAGIWGGSFIFMRVLAPVLGPVVTADARVLIAGAALWAWLAASGVALDLRRFWKEYCIIGALNCALPFVLFAFAALHIPAAYSAVMNATAPLFGALFSALWLGDRLTRPKVAGLASGICGVALISRAGAAAAGPLAAAAVCACLVAAVCYALSGIYMKKFVRDATPIGIATGSQLAAGAMLLPPALLFPPTGALTPAIAANVLGLALLCSGIAFLIYYRLMADVGPTRALTVTFLIPPFGILWGVLFLGEQPTVAMGAGCVMVLAGTVLVVRGPPRAA